jgi:competence protein ComEC
LPYLLTRVPADRIYLPVSPTTQEFATLAELDCEGVILVNETMFLSLDNAMITIAGPILSNSDNESGLCILFQAGNCDILITGDRSSAGEELLMRQIAIPKLELLIVGHHGSKYSTSERLLGATKPTIAVISVGADNFYGHPSPEAVYRLIEAGCVIYRTDLHGTVIFRR